ncbi:hypothetical protein F3Y22_tig00001478pilonHSYRG00272 [Hibiscus syriacus]|uniref:RNase H type-1 domain-containing protein n=1 Tax=Hibiscus syriacus TaxID=106335 RepID=A0A6A3CV44_HIBSY|nr:hypothetical protein F3Y22_tig00001478pilonHSYRG00272 [Hibiscus syriacus]
MNLAGLTEAIPQEAVNAGEDSVDRNSGHLGQVLISMGETSLEAAAQQDVNGEGGEVGTVEAVESANQRQFVAAQIGDDTSTPIFAVHWVSRVPQETILSFCVDSANLRRVSDLTLLGCLARGFHFGVFPGSYCSCHFISATLESRWWPSLTQHQEATEVRDRAFYRLLWSQSIPEKDRICIWRAFRNLLQCSANLYQKHVLPSSVCFRCGLAPKSILHSIWDCQHERPVWSPPASGYVKLNFDGSFDSVAGLGGVGCVVRDSMGRFIYGAAKHIPCAMDSFHVEVVACLEGMLLARSSGYNCVVVEGDSLSVISRASSSMVGSSYGAPILAQIWDIIASFDQCRFSHVDRTRNAVANAFTHEDLFSGSVA